ncbi:MAG: Ig-like domain-containing protein [Pirellulales bacterium]
MRRPRLEVLEGRLLLSLAGVVGVPPLGGLEWLSQPTDEPAEPGLPPEIAFSGEAGILTASPAAPDLLDISDTGVSNTDNLTNLDNSAPEKSLRFSVGNTIAGATVTLYADGTPIGSAVADGTTTTVTTNGSLDLADGRRAITARQTVPGEDESPDSAALEVTIDTVAPSFLNPVSLGGYDTSGSAEAVVVSGTLAYVADSAAGLQIIDITNPALPVRLGTYLTSGRAFDVAVSGTLAYVVDETAGLQIIDVSNPADPVRLGGCKTGGSSRGVSVRGTVAYVADRLEGLQIIDVSKPTLPERLGGYKTSWGPLDVAVSGTLAYVADNFAGLQIIDVTDPAAPVRLGAYDTRSSAEGVAVVGTLAYVANGSIGLEIIDVANPAAPVRLGGCNTSGTAHAVAVRGTLAYVADYSGGLQIIDVADPRAPAWLGAFDTGGVASGVDVLGTTVFVADWSSGLQIVDVSPLGSLRAPDLQAASDTGISSADDITSDNTPTFVCTLPGGPYFRFYRDAEQISGDYESGNSYTTAVQADGTYGYCVTPVDAAGNVPLPSPALSVTVDTSIPSAPDLLAASDSGISSADDRTNLDNSAPERTLQFAVGNTIAGATVTLYADGTPVASALADSATTIVTTNGSFDLGDGMHLITARQALPGQGESTESPILRLWIDTGAPATPPAPSLQAGTSGTDNITGDTTPTFSSSVPSGLYFRFYRDGIQISGDYETGAAYTTPLQPDGTYAYSILVVDAAGNTSTCSLALSVTVDGSIPAAPDLLPISDTGISHTDDLANLDNSQADRSLQFLVDNTIAGATVTLYADGTAIGSAVAEGAATIVTTNGGFDLVDGQHSITARQTLAGGNELPTSAALTLTIDTSPPAASSAPGLQAGLSSTVGITGDNTPTFTFSLPAGCYFRFYRDGMPLSADIGTGSSYTAAVQVDGTYEYSVASVDAAGNVSTPSAALSLTIDSSIPSAPELLAISDTGLSSSDHLTALDNSAPEKSLQFAIGNTIVGATVTVYADGTAIGSATADGATTTLVTNGSVDIRDGWRAITAGQTLPGQAESRGSARLYIAIDTVAFAAPGAPDLQVASDTGISNTDKITSDRTPTFSLSVSTESYYRFYRDGVQISADYENGSPTTYTTPVQPDGSYNYTVAAVDTAGNVSASSPAVSVTIDASIPWVPNLSALSDTGVFSTDNVTHLDNRQPEDSLQCLVANTQVGATVTLYVDGLPIGSAVAHGTTTTVATNGSESLADGLHSISARQTVPGEEESRESAATRLIIDTSAPAPPSAPVLQAASDTGISSTDNITGDATPSFTLSVPAGLYWRVYRDGVQISGDYGAGTSYTTPGQLDGTYVFTVAAVDAAGNVSGPSLGLLVTIDTTIPSAPDLQAISDTGIPTNDNLTRLDNSDAGRSLRFLIGNTVAGAIVTLYADGVAIGNALASPTTTTVVTNGMFDLADGTHAITARQAAPGRPESTDSAALSVTIDTIPPATPLPPDLQAASDTGVSNTDNITSDSTPTFSLSLPSGSYGRFYRDGVQISGDYEVSGSYTAPLHPDGTYEYALAAVDRAGNVSGLSSRLAVTIDTAIPATPDLAADSDSGVSSNDNLTNRDNSDSGKSLQFAVGNTIAGATVTLYANGVAIGSVVAEGTTTTVPTNGTLDLADGTHAITARQTLPGRKETTASSALTVTIDTSPPAPLSAPDLQSSSDTGISSTDNTTSDTTPSFTLSAPAGSYWRVYRDGVQISDDYGTGAAYTTPGQVDGTYVFTVAAVDAAGNVSGSSPALSVAIDASIPLAPDLLPVSDTGLSSTDNLTNLDNSQPAKSLQFAIGNTIAGATVTLYAGGVAIGSAVADGAATTVLTSGSFDLADGSRAISARQTVPGRPESTASAVLNVTVDTSPPPTPSPPDLQAASDTGISNTDNITSDNTPTFAIAVAGTSYYRFCREGVPISGDYETGASYTPPVQTDGVWAYAVATVDSAGNASALSPALSVTIDASIPSVPDLVATSDTGVSTTDNITNLNNSDLEKSLRFTIANTIAGETVTLYADGAAVGSAVADGATTVVTTSGSSELADGTHAITARQTRAGEAETTDSAILSVTIDTVAPGTPLGPDLQAASDTGVSNSDNITGDRTPTFDLAATGSYFRFYRDGVQISGDYQTGATYTTAIQDDGVYGYAVAAVDAAGNTSTLSPPLFVTVDTSIPFTPNLLAVSDTGISNTDSTTNLDNSTPDKTLQFTVGNTIAGATVTLYADGMAIGSAVADGATTTIATTGSMDLADGWRRITARQTPPGRPESTESLALTVVIDTTIDTLNPSWLGSYDMIFGLQGLAVSGMLAYGAGSSSGLTVVDVSEPAAPVRRGALDLPWYDYANSVAVSGTRAYVADGFAGLQIVDVMNPAVPVRVGGYDTSGSARAVAISDTKAYVADDYAGLQILDVTNPAAPVRLGGYDTTGSARGVAVSGTLAYVATQSAGLQIIDVTNPATPKRLGGFDTSGSARDIAVVGTLAYVADESAGLVILDVTDPAAPVWLGSYDTTGTAYDVVVSGTLAYVADGLDGLQIIDVTNSAAPMKAGEIRASGWSYSVVVAGTLVYLADSDGLQIIDPTGTPDLQRGSDTGISSTDNITADATPTFKLPAPSGHYSRIYRNGVQISGDYQAGSSYTTAVQPDGTYDYTIAVVDTAGNVSPQSAPLVVTIDTTAPTVAASVVNGGAAQRSQISSLAVQFSEDVSASLGATDLTLVNRDSGAAVNVTGVTPTYDPATQTATWNLSGIALEDGYYRATLNAGGIFDVAGNFLAGGNYPIEFFRLLGDTDGNAAIDIFDVAKVQVNYGQTSGMSPAEGDFDGNGTVDIFDVALLQVQYGKTLAPPAPAPAAAPAAVESERGHATFSPRDVRPRHDLDAEKSSVPVGAGRGAEQPTLPLVASQPGHSPGESSKLAEPLGGRVSGPPTTFAERKATIRGPEKGPIDFSGTARHSVEYAKPRKSRFPAFPKPALTLAVHHAAENAAWESAVDRVLEEDGETSELRV